MRRRARFPRERASPTAWSTARSTACRWKSSRWPSTTRSRPSRRRGSTRTTCRRPGTQLLEVAKKLTTADRFGVLFETDAGLLPELHLVSLHVAGRRRVPDAGRQKRVRLAGDGAGAEALAGRDQHAASPRAKSSAAAAAISSPISAPATAPCRTSASGASRRWRTTPRRSIRHLQAADAGQRQIRHRRWRLGLRRQRQGKDPETAAKFCAWALGFDGQGFGSARRRLVHGRQSRHAAAQQRASRQSGRRFSKGKLSIFSERGLSRHAGRAARCRRRSTRSSPTRSRRRQLGGADCQQTATAASQQLDAFLASYSGRADPVSRYGAVRIHRRSRRFMPSHRSRERQAIAAATGLPATCSSCPMRWGSSLFVGLPMLLALAMGFFEVDGFGGYRFVGFANYCTACGRSAVLAGLRRSRSPTR